MKFHWGMKALIELHFQHEALPRFIENVLRSMLTALHVENEVRSTLSYPNETSKECIQFLSIRRKTRLVPFVIHGRHISMECMCAYWESPNVNFQNK